MANPEHVAVVLKGKDAIAEWRRRNPGVSLDLSEANLGNADLVDADLRGANLSAANLNHASLNGANLSKADLTKAVLVAAWLNRANLTGAKLAGADLGSAFLVGARLDRSQLTGANLLYVNLLRAHLSRADLSEADLTLTSLLQADLSGSNLGGADLSGADLNSAELSGANLHGATLFMAKVFLTELSDADFSQATFAYSSVGNVDLSEAVGLGTVNHQAPSSVGVDTLIRSFRGAGNKLTPDLEAFFRGAGVPSELLDALPRIVAEVKYHGCFISYGQPDVAFAARLREDLEARGVSCWLYEMDKTVGEPTWHEIEQKLEEYDRMVVVCSIDALMRDGVKKEIDKQIDKSQDKLVPVSLDDRWTQPGFAVQWAGRDLKGFLMERNRADFSRWESDPQQYQKALGDLLKGLKRPSG